MTQVTRRKILKSAASAATLGASTLAAPGIIRLARAQDQTIRFGGSIPFSGNWGEVGQAVHTGYQTVARFVNEELGGVEIGGTRYMIDVTMADDASDPQRAVTLVQRAVDEGVQYLLGSYSSGIVLPTAAIAARARLPMVQAGGGADAIFAQGNEWIFGMYPRASRSAYPAVELFASLDPRPQTVSIAYANDPFSRPQGEGVRERLLELGFTLLDEFQLPAEVQDASSMLSAIRQNPPDVFACLTSGQNSFLIARQMASSNTYVDLPFISLGPQLPGFEEALGAYADGFVCISTWDPSFPYSDPFFGSTADFADYFREVNPDTRIIYHHGTSAGAMVAYLLALQAAGSPDDPSAVRDALAALDTETLYGVVNFTEDGDGDPVKMGSGVTQRQDGEIRMIYPERLATAEPVYPVAPWDDRG